MNLASSVYEAEDFPEVYSAIEMYSSTQTFATGRLHVNGGPAYDRHYQSDASPDSGNSLTLPTTLARPSPSVSPAGSDVTSSFYQTNLSLSREIFYFVCQAPFEVQTKIAGVPTTTENAVFAAKALIVSPVAGKTFMAFTAASLNTIISIPRIPGGKVAESAAVATVVKREIGVVIGTPLA